jgi:hypothetical protein
MIAAAWLRAHSSVCSTSARVAFVSSVALVPCLLDQPRGSRLGLGELLVRLLLRFLRQLARLGFGRVQHLRALALALLPVALDLTLTVLQLTLAARDLLLGAPKLRGGGRLRVALDRVGHLGRGADHVQRVPCARRARSGSAPWPDAWRTRSCTWSCVVWRRKASNASRTVSRS